MSTQASFTPPARPQEQLLIAMVPELPATQTILCTSAGLAQFARAAAERYPQAAVTCHYLDLYRADEARRAQGGSPENLAIKCAADFPPGEFDLAALPLSSRGEAELTRELLQAAQQRLPLDGLLLAATDNPADQWLHQEMRKLFSTVTRRPADDGVVYLARKRAPLKKTKSFDCQFAFRDRDRLIQVYSRPGVFAHRRVDAGARQILGAMEIQPQDRVLDIGCGSGVLSLAAAARAEGVRVHAVDSHARAVECTARGAELNGLANITTELNASGDCAGAGSYQVVLANPPYYAAMDIARRFVLSGHAAVAPGGRILLVTKSPQWYAENMPQWFEEVRIEESKGYFLVWGRKGDE